MRNVILILIVFIMVSFGLNGQDIINTPNTTVEGNLPRKAQLDFSVGPFDENNIYDSKRAMVTSIDTNSIAWNSGLRPGDLIMKINNTSPTNAINAFELLNNLPGDVPVKIIVERGNRKIDLEFTPERKPLEGLKKVHTTYGELVTEEGIRLRTLLTIPVSKFEDTAEKYPAILLSDWTSCESIETPYRLNRGWINLVRGLVEETGAIVLRIDKPGVGDSQGFCSELDFDQTIAYQRKALEKLKSHPRVDPSKIFIFGESVGSFMAPLVAKDQQVAGVMVYGGGATTWFERMVEFERKQRELSGMPLEKVDDEMKDIISFLHYYLVEGYSLEDIWSVNPDLERVWMDLVSHNSKNKHYGRPIAFHQQAQKHNFAEAWIECNAPVLVMIGEYDQFESIRGAKTIVNVIKHTSNHNAELKIYPKMNHQLEVYPTPVEAFSGLAKNRSIGSSLVIYDVINWMNKVLLEK